jgi:1,4-alpha-glucan branching enzyme
MKRVLLLVVASVAVIFVNAQLLTWSPAFPKETDNITITVDATKGNQGLMGFAGNVYVHIGAITSLSSGASDWKHAPFTWGSAESAALATSAGANKWSYTINNPRSFFNLAAGEELKYIAILFRQGNCTNCSAQRNADGSDMYVPIYTGSLSVRIDQPASQPKYVRVPEQQNWTVGTAFAITANASKLSSLKLYHNGIVIASQTNIQTLSGNSTVTSIGNQQIVAEANDGTTLIYDTLNIFVSPASSPVAALPSGVKDGINYEAGDTSVTLVLRAPGKNRAIVIGDFSNWVQNAGFIMNKTPDGKFFWLRVHPLATGTEYGYQYVVDDSIKIADPFTEKILDPADQNISSTTYPNLKPYPSGQSGMISVLRTAEPTYNWSINNFTRPDKRNLVIYELLVRDFVAAHNWKTVTDNLNYLKKLGVNAIEVMPFNEFEGNISWGYNPDFYFAPDKYYGTKTALKTFIDSCHKKGIAVIMDIVLNHTYGPSPLKLLYNNTSNGSPASNNPWYNVAAPHAFGFGDDFNHESADTKYFFTRVLQHWLTEYKIDGYRFDFSKGLTQKSSSNDAAFSAYDASRIAIINEYNNAIKAVDANAYLILEHFCDNTEEKELSDNGMMLWANVWTQYQEASMGYIGNSNLERGIHSVRGWNNPHLVTFMESHDEERITYKNIKYGNTAGSYNVKDTATALKRMELNAAFLFTIPGPKMIWEFGELGYDYSRCYLSANGEGGDCDRKLDPKPVRWDYINDNRRKSVYNTYSSLISLRFHPWYKNAFTSGTIDQSLSGNIKWIKVSSGDTSHLLVVGNFDVTSQTATVAFQTVGTWYDYLNNTTFTSTGSAQSISLQPGEFHVYVNRNVNNLSTTPVVNIPWDGNDFQAKVYPNPAPSNFTVELNLPQRTDVQIDLYTTLGQQITTFHNGQLTKGTHQLSLDRQAISTGMYYLKITTKSTTKTIQVTFQ